MNETDDLLTEVQELTWALVDECATEKEVRRLESLLLDDDAARRIYVMCMQMHADLHFLLNSPPQLPTAVQKLIEDVKAKQAKHGLPLVDLPPTNSHPTYTNGCT
jgi:hypothetical protein